MEHIDPTAVIRYDTRSSRPCEFCRQFDPRFADRRTPDQVIASARKAAASAHLTEDGYVRHRILELRQLGTKTPQAAA